jgi:CubicO group peptidase (beta-lactamase class C family)
MAGLPRLPKGMLRRALRERENPHASFGPGDLERAIREARLKRPPGEKIRYSNFGFGLLGHVLARRAGLSFEALVDERVCRPLALTDTMTTVPDETSHRYADGHSRRGKPVPHWDLPTLAGAGALRSTPADLLRYVDLQLDPRPSRLGRAVELTHEPVARRGQVAQCLGWMLLRGRGGRAPLHWHSGGTGGFRGFVGFSLSTGTGVVVLASSARSVDKIGFSILREL